MCAFKCQKPFEGYVGYKVYHAHKDRYYYHMTYKGEEPALKGKKRTTSVARYKMAVSLGYELSPFVDVDHLNGIPSDDRMENLQILSKQENRMKETYENQADYMVTIPCTCCGKDVERHRTDISQADRLFCDEHCETAFYSMIKT